MKEITVVIGRAVVACFHLFEGDALVLLLSLGFMIIPSGRFHARWDSRSNGFCMLLYLFEPSILAIGFWFNSLLNSC